MGPFEITKELVAGLGDEALRALLNSLLEAEAMRRGIPLSCISVGGNQTAGDGGVDGSIAWAGMPDPSGWLPKRTIYFQSKAEDMARQKLLKEMRPDGMPRALFAELAKEGGAYIVFSTNDVTDSGYRSRLAAMREAVADVSQAEQIHLDFYGADRIARWASEFPGVSASLLQQAGKSVAGWRPYGSWSAPNVEQTLYFHDAEARASVGGNDVPITAAITAMRRALAVPGGVVRLIGISGMGKTRLAEALFDPAIDPETALPPSSAIYGDAGTDLTVGSALLAEQLVASGVSAVIVVDNTNVRMHAQLTEVVGRQGGRTSLLTIDYNNEGEQIGSTLLVQLGGNSEQVLEQVLHERFPKLSSMDRSHVANFAGGNARVALKIAEGAEDGVSLAALNDTQLLDRLFQNERHQPDPNARRCGEAAALVYAFYMEEGDGYGPEYEILAQLAGVSAVEFFRQIAIFLDWGIVQQRGPQRAVMPPPIANMLASDTIRRIPRATLLDTMQAGPLRLFTSFARRLGYLHHVPVAVELARFLLSRDGTLGRPALLDEARRNAFIAIAPAAPEEALEAIERALAGRDRERLIVQGTTATREFAGLLVHFAFDAHLFSRAMSALLQFVLEAGSEDDRGESADLFLERFWIVLSFTQANSKTRLDFVDGLLDDESPRVRMLGLRALGRMLKTSHFSSSQLTRFGTRSQSDEWRPNADEQREWFVEAFQKLTDVARSDDPDLKERARSIIAGNVREHLYAGYPELMLDALETVAEDGYWGKGWAALSEGLHFERGGLPQTHLNRVIALERRLRPSRPEHFFEVFVLGEPWRHWHPAAREHHYTRNAGLLARAVGKHLVRSEGALDEFRRRALAAQGATSVYEFERGIGATAPDLAAQWTALKTDFGNLDHELRNPNALAGYLSGAARRDPDWVASELDAAVTDPLIGPYLVELHAGVALDASAMDRFSRALSSGMVAPGRFSSLMYGGATKPIPAPDLARFLIQLHAIEEGIHPAVEVLHMRVYGDRTDGREVASELNDLARRIVADPRTFAVDYEPSDLGVKTVAKFAMMGDGGEDSARQICRALRGRQETNRYRHRDFDEVCRKVLEMHPLVVLDEIVGQSEVSDELVGRFFGGPSRDDELGGRVADVDDDLLMEWVAQAPHIRARRVAHFVQYAEQDETGNLRWSPLALRLIDAGPDPTGVLHAFEDRFFTGTSSGSFAGRFIRRRPLLTALASSKDRTVRNWARQAQQRLEHNISSWNRMDRDRESRFE